MTASRQTWIAICAVGFLASSFGCVSTGKYDELAAQRDNLAAERLALIAERDGLMTEVAVLGASSEKLADSLAASKLRAEKIRGSYGQLVTELQAEVAAGQIEVQQLVDGVRLNVSDELLFGSGSSQLNEQGRALMKRVAAQIANDEAIVSIEGHTDNVGISSSLKTRFPTNWELAASRATSVVRLLSEEGVDPKRLRAVSRGPFSPVASNETAEGRAKNRRTEILLRPVVAEPGVPARAQ
jgi:chemotaxis protein MotB